MKRAKTAGKQNLPPTLVVGDTVTWSSQSRSNATTKEGTIVQVVPAGTRPDKVAFAALYNTGYGCGYGRGSDSYVVQVKNKFYWPRASQLVRTGGTPP